MKRLQQSITSSWTDMACYQSIKQSVSNLVVINDPAERALGLLTEFDRKSTPKSEEQRQYSYKIVKELRSQQLKVATSSERITKLSLAATYY